MLVPGPVVPAAPAWPAEQAVPEQPAAQLCEQVKDVVEARQAVNPSPVDDSAFRSGSPAPF
jgi:hypothetical protein